MLNVSARKIAIPVVGLVILAVTAVINPSLLVLVCFGVIIVLIGFQRAKYSRYLKLKLAQQNEGDLLGSVLLYSASLIGCYLLMLWLAWTNLSNWPRSGSYWYLVVFIMSIGVIYQTLMQINWIVIKALPSKRLLIRVMAMILGFGLAGEINKFAAEVAATQIQRHHQVLLELLAKVNSASANSASANSASVTLGDQLLCSNFREYLRSYSGHRYYRPQSLHSLDKDYLMTFHGGSIDMDGSTIVYESKNNNVSVFHNDLYESRKALEEKQSAMVVCDLSLVED